MVWRLSGLRQRLLEAVARIVASCTTNKIQFLPNQNKSNHTDNFLLTIHQTEFLLFRNRKSLSLWVCIHRKCSGKPNCSVDETAFICLQGFTTPPNSTSHARRSPFYFLSTFLLPSPVHLTGFILYISSQISLPFLACCRPITTWLLHKQIWNRFKCRYFFKLHFKTFVLFNFTEWFMYVY